jgi:hypothetical protein
MSAVLARFVVLRGCTIMLNLRKYRFQWVVLLLLLTAPVASAQQVVSVRPGLISYVEGKVFLVDDLDSDPDFDILRHLEAPRHLRTEEGHAEVMLDPGIYLRLNGETRVEMVRADLSDVQVRLVHGSVVVEARKKPAWGRISILSGDAAITVERKGIFRLDAPPDGPPQLRVSRGEFAVSVDGVSYEVGAKESLRLGGSAPPMLISKFDRSEKDAFDRWNRDRTDAIAQDERARQQAGNRGDCGTARSPCLGYPYPGMYPGSYPGGYGGGSSGGPANTVRTPAPAPSPPAASSSGGGRSGHQ